MDRALNVLVPLQLGVITDVLSKGEGKIHPLKTLQRLLRFLSVPDVNIFNRKASLEGDHDLHWSSTA